MSSRIEGLGFGFWAEGLRVRTFEKESQMVVLHGCCHSQGDPDIDFKSLLSSMHVSPERGPYFPETSIYG